MLGDEAWLAVRKVLEGFEVRAVCKAVKVFHAKLGKPFLYESGFVYGSIIGFKQEMA